jgi:hypothetical protein
VGGKGNVLLLKRVRVYLWVGKGANVTAAELLSLEQSQQGCCCAQHPTPSPAPFSLKWHACCSAFSFLWKTTLQPLALPDQHSPFILPIHTLRGATVSTILPPPPSPPPVTAAACKAGK